MDDSFLERLNMFTMGVCIILTMYFKILATSHVIGNEVECHRWEPLIIVLLSLLIWTKILPLSIIEINIKKSSK